MATETAQEERTALRASTAGPESDSAPSSTRLERPVTSEDSPRPGGDGSRPRTTMQAVGQTAGKYGVLAGKYGVSTVSAGGGVAVQAASRLLLEGSGSKPTDSAHDERQAYREARSQAEHADKVADSRARLAKGETAPTLDETKAKLDGAETEEERVRAAQEHMAMFRAKQLEASGTVGAGRMKARSRQLIKGMALGKAVESSGHRAGYETTMQESADLLGADLTRTPEGLSMKGSGPAPEAQEGGKKAQSRARFHRGIQGVGAVIGGDNGEEDLLRGNTKTALAKGVGGTVRDAGLKKAGKLIDAHGGMGLGSTAAKAGGAIVGGIVGGIGTAIGAATGLEAKAAHQDKVDAYDKHWNGGEDGVNRAQEIEERGFRPRPQANGFNDSKAGLPSVNYAKKGESWSEARAKAAEEGKTYEKGGIVGAAKGLGAGIAGAATGLYRNAVGSAGKAWEDAKKLPGRKLADWKDTARSTWSSLKSGVATAGKYAGAAGDWLASKVRGLVGSRPRTSPQSEDEGIELQRMR